VQPYSTEMFPNTRRERFIPSELLTMKLSLNLNGRLAVKISSTIYTLESEAWDTP
jgi:hypothetical protein